MAEHGIRDYGLAKRKAAKQLNLPPDHALPSNSEVDQALQERQALFEPEEQTAWLQKLRLEAMQVMRVFAAFEPVLVGAVASGAVSEHSQIELDILVETSKEFEQTLINQGIEFKSQDRGGRMAYLIYADPADVLVRMVIHEPRSGQRPHLSLKQLEKLLAASAPNDD